MVADPWLSAQLGHEVFRVDWPGPEAAGPSAARLNEHAQRHSGAMYAAKVPAGDIASVQALSGAGFYVVDVNITLTRRSGPVPRVDPMVRVRVCEPADREGVLDIAGSAFRYSRFHLDPFIPLQAAHAVKRAWIESYVRGVRGDCLLVALDSTDRPAGFLAALAGPEERGGPAVIDLLGVHPGRQRSGVGTALVAAFLDHYRDRTEHRVGTQGANVPSLAFYQRFGFSITESVYVLHKHARP